MSKTSAPEIQYIDKPTIVTAQSIAQAVLQFVRELIKEGCSPDAVINVGIETANYAECRELCDSVYGEIQQRVASHPSLDIEVQEVTAHQRGFGRWSLVVRLYL